MGSGDRSFISGLDGDRRLTWLETLAIGKCARSAEQCWYTRSRARVRLTCRTRRSAAVNR